MNYKLSENDLSEVKYNSKDCTVDLTPLTEKTLIILSKMLGGLHHLPFGHLGKLVMEKRSFISYLYQGSLATTDYNSLFILVLMAHELAVRVEIQRTKKNGILILFHERSHDIKSELPFHPTMDYAIKYFKEYQN